MCCIANGTIAMLLPFPATTKPKTRSSYYPAVTLLLLLIHTREPIDQPRDGKHPNQKVLSCSIHFLQMLFLPDAFRLRYPSFSTTAFETLSPSVYIYDTSGTNFRPHFCLKVHIICGSLFAEAYNKQLNTNN